MKNVPAACPVTPGSEIPLVDNRPTSANALPAVLHTRQMVAKSLCVSPRTIDNWVRAGLPHMKLSPRMVRFDLAEVLIWMRSNYGTRR